MIKNLSRSILVPAIMVLSGLIWPTVNLNATAGQPEDSDAAVRLVMADNGNTARYLVREQLAGVDFPNDAVSETNAVTGAVVFNANGEVIQDESRIAVNITGLTSDNNRRDGYIQRRILEGETYPVVELVPIQTSGLEFVLPSSGTATFDIVVYLTVRGVTEVTSRRVTAQFLEISMTGTARTEFKFAEFGMEKPSVGTVLSVADAIRLELDFNLNVENPVSSE